MNNNSSHNAAPIGIFDSGFGGLSILREIRKVLPQYDYIFLGDNARAPYGTRSFQLVYEFTLQSVKYLFEQGCQLVILACNTASAKALRNIQQNNLPHIDPARRVLGVIRPTVEKVGEISRTGCIGVFGTPGTIQSQSYDIAIAKMHPGFKVYGHACPMWVPLVENRESEGDGADYFVKKDIDALLAQCPDIDTVILGCTHYPLLIGKIKKYMPPHIHVIEQGHIVAESLKDYLNRHPEMEVRCAKGGSCQYLTTEDARRFSSLASVFVNEEVDARHITLAT
jgi:glutamate racemase